MGKCPRTLVPTYTGGLYLQGAKRVRETPLGRRHNDNDIDEIASHFLENDESNNDNNNSDDDNDDNGDDNNNDNNNNDINDNNNNNNDINNDDNINNDNDRSIKSFVMSLQHKPKFVKHTNSELLFTHTPKTIQDALRDIPKLCTNETYLVNKINEWEEKFNHWLTLFDTKEGSPKIKSSNNEQIESYSNDKSDHHEMYRNEA
ncbi:hypothetical protein C1645_838920 [Glomus cerebriforme]|uniref:Uncharacterized protein n=1 Tax=Glomus cerebriforme TaxID=658196 RepID=A0A397S496_9GLOM|nr:hypothetical protein C1645_838920 [Glomus cerebriforme]